MGENENVEEVLREDGGDRGSGETAVTAEMQKIQEERDGLYDRLLRKQAEFENYKKRVERERAEYVQFASADLIRELLNALDSFDLAIRNAASDASHQSMLEGFNLIYKQFQDTLTRFGLKTIETKGQKFDPNIHQAVTTTVTDEVEENTIVDEFRKGYMLNGRLLRPAMVNVAVRHQ